MSIKIGPTDFRKHRPSDQSDPGFSILGFKLRWVSGRVREINTDRPWLEIKRSMLPKELIDHIERHMPGAFSTGDTIRRYGGELVLAMASDEEVKIKKADIRKKAVDQEKSVRRDAVFNQGGMESRITENETTDSTLEMMERFKGGKSS